MVSDASDPYIRFDWTGLQEGWVGFEFDLIVYGLLSKRFVQDTIEADFAFQ